MARPKKFTDVEKKERRKTQTREAVRRTRKKKSDIVIISEGPVDIISEDFLSGEKTVVESWETVPTDRQAEGARERERLAKGARRAAEKGVHDCAEAVKADPAGTLKLDDTIPDVIPKEVNLIDSLRKALDGSKEEWEL